MSELRSVIRLRTMAEAAANVAEQPGPNEGLEMARAYTRLRDEAAALCARAGWGTEEDFARELPPLNWPPPGEMFNIRGKLTAQQAYDAVGAGQRARVLLGQLAAWAMGHQEAFAIEEQMRANAAAAGEARERRPPGFRA